MRYGSHGQDSGNQIPDHKSKANTFYGLLSLVQNSCYSHIILVAVLGPASLMPLTICSIQLQSWCYNMARSLRRKPPSESGAAIICNYCSGVGGTLSHWKCYGRSRTTCNLNLRARRYQYLGELNTFTQIAFLQQLHLYR